MSFIDIHTHILPHIDDGAKSILDSVALLEQEKANGTDYVICTPHFYTDYSDFDVHLSSVKKAFNELSSYIKNLDLPEIHLGYEVAYFLNMHRSTDIAQCTLGNSNYLLLELPFSMPLTADMLNDIEKLSDDIGFNVIIAHIERYSHDKLYKKLISLVKNNTVFAQINADSLFTNTTKKCVEKLLKANLVSFVASDAHSVEKRPVKTEKCLREIKNKYKKAYDRIISSTEELLTYIR